MRAFGSCRMPRIFFCRLTTACACTGGVFQDCYNVVGGVDHVIPVDVYVPGCAAKPEAIIDGVVLALEVVKGKLGLRDMPQTTIFE